MKTHMDIFINDLTIMQVAFESAINKRFNIDEENTREYAQERILALLVELGELANETRCFKFWSTQEPAEKLVILEEYVDCIHLCLSLGLSSGNLIDRGTSERLYFISKEPTKFVTDKELSEQFNAAYKAVVNYGAFGEGYASYLGMFQQILNLGSALGFTLAEIHEGYHEKNKKNRTRQSEGY